MFSACSTQPTTKCTCTIAINYQQQKPYPGKNNSGVQYYITETKMSSFWWNLHHWLHRKLSKWQLSVQPVMKLSSKWWHFRFSDSVWLITRKQTFIYHHEFLSNKKLEVYIERRTMIITEKENIVILTKFSSVAALDVVVSSAANDENFHQNEDISISVIFHNLLPWYNINILF